jgi:hypothetical protein
MTTVLHTTAYVVGHIGLIVEHADGTVDYSQHDITSTASSERVAVLVTPEIERKMIFAMIRDYRLGKDINAIATIILRNSNTRGMGIYVQLSDDGRMYDGSLRVHIAERARQPEKRARASQRSSHSCNRKRRKGAAMETNIRIITVPYKPPPPGGVVVYDDGEYQRVIQHDPSLYNKDCIWFPREWSNDPDLHLYDDDDEDVIEVRPAGTVVTWLKERGWPCETITVGRTMETIPLLQPEQEAWFRARWIDEHWNAEIARRAALQRRRGHFRLSK